MTQTATAQQTNRYYAIDRSQGETAGGCAFGYVFVGEGGLFFEWRYDEDAPHNEQVRQVIDTLSEDDNDAPTGVWTRTRVERSLRHHIAQYGLYAMTATA